MRLIDVDRLQKPISASDDNIVGIGMTLEEIDGYNEGVNETWRRIKNAPTIEAEPLRHGHWTCEEIYKEKLSYGGIGYTPLLICSACSRRAESYMRYDEPVMPEDMDGWNYCPNCGAKMDEGEEE